MIDNLQEDLRDCNACSAGLEYALQFDDPIEAWKACPHAGWLAWIAESMGYPGFADCVFAPDSSLPSSEDLDPAITLFYFSFDPRPGDAWCDSDYSRCFTKVSNKWVEVTADEIRKWLPLPPI